MKKTWGVGRWFFVILITPLIISSSLSYSGFCFKDFKYLSNQEKIDVAVEDILEGQMIYGRIRLEHPTLKNPPNNVKEIIKYKNKYDFYIENHNCCRLLDSLKSSEGIRRLSFLDKLFGLAETFVVIEYKVKFLTNDNIEDYRVNTMPTIITNCGVSWMD